MPCLCFRSYEQLLIRNSENSEEKDAQATSTLRKKGLSDLKRPSFAVTNSLVLDIDTTLTNSHSALLIPGPASSYSAIYTALMRAQNVSTWACGGSSKVLASLDLDLYEKAYLLVNSNCELRNRFVLCLGELHIVFAHIRGIGSYVGNSGLETAWMHANWFDSPCLLSLGMPQHEACDHY